MYKCELCGKEYDSPVERSKCVLNCEGKRELKAAEEKRANFRKKCVESRNDLRKMANEFYSAVENHNKNFSDTIELISYFPDRLRSTMSPSRFPNFTFVDLL